MNLLPSCKPSSHVAIPSGCAAFLALYVLVSSSAASFESAAQDKRGLLQILKSQAQSVPNFDVILTCDFEQYVEASNADESLYQSVSDVKRRFVRTVRQRYASGKLRIDELESAIHGKIAEGDSAFAWDGIKSRTFSAGQAKGTIESSIMTRATPLGLSYPILFRGMRHNLNYGDWLEEACDIQSVEEVESDLNVIQIVAVPDTGDSRNAGYSIARFEIKVVPSKGYCPSEIVWYHRFADGVHKHTRIENTEFAEVLKGKWFPVSTKVTTYATEEWPGSGIKTGGVLSAHYYEVDLDRSEFGMPLAPAVFELDFADGTLVQDLLKKKQYRVGNEDKAIHLEKMAKLGQVIRTSLAAESGTIANSKSNRLLYLNILIVVVLALVFYYKKFVQTHV